MSELRRGEQGPEIERFQFGKNWRGFLALIDEERIAHAERSLRTMLDLSGLEGKSFLDIGSGSGLFSLAARRLGARVHSFDDDPESVACTAELKRRYFPEDDRWTVERASVLDRGYLESLGTFDVVYSWGVLHHTGAMWRALDNAAVPVAPVGLLFISIYNDQGWITRYWTAVKRAYSRNALLRAAAIATHSPYLVGLRLIVRALRGNPPLERGMSVWHDMLDWLGGYPFEAAAPGEIVRRYDGHGFSLVGVKTCGRRHGCNEFVFRRQGRHDSP